MKVHTLVFFWFFLVGGVWSGEGSKVAPLFLVFFVVKGGGKGVGESFGSVGKEIKVLSKS